MFGYFPFVNAINLLHTTFAIYCSIQIDVLGTPEVKLQRRPVSVTLKCSTFLKKNKGNKQQEFHVVD